MVTSGNTSSHPPVPSLQPPSGSLKISHLLNTWLVSCIILGEEFPFKFKKNPKPNKTTVFQYSQTRYLKKQYSKLKKSTFQALLHLRNFSCDLWRARTKTYTGVKTYPALGNSKAGINTSTTPLRLSHLQLRTLEQQTQHTLPAPQHRSSLS